MAYLISILLLLLGCAAAWGFRRDRHAFGRAVLSLARTMDTSTAWVAARKRRR